MSFIQTEIQGVVIFEPTVFKDERGYFFESYNADVFKKAGIDTVFVQDNESKSSYGVVRGIHFQKEPYAQAKLVRVLYGKVLDVAVDLRKGSKTFGQHIACELSGENKRQFFIPRGFGHGFSVLSETAVFAYKCDNFYCKEAEGGIYYADETLGIDWKIPADKIVLSEKDKNHKRFKECF